MVEADDIPEAIRAIRLRAGLTQTEFADALGTNSTSVSRWERGDAAPQKNMRAKICAQFNEDPETLGISPIAARRHEQAAVPEEAPEWAEEMIDTLLRRLDALERRIDALSRESRRRY